VNEHLSDSSAGLRSEGFTALGQVRGHCCLRLASCHVLLLTAFLIWMLTLLPGTAPIARRPYPVGGSPSGGAATAGAGVAGCRDHSSYAFLHLRRQYFSRPKRMVNCVCALIIACLMLRPYAIVFPRLLPMTLSHVHAVQNCSPRLTSTVVFISCACERGTFIRRLSSRPTAIMNGPVPRLGFLRHHLRFSGS